MPVAYGPERKPDRDDQTSVLQLNAVGRHGGEDTPVIALAKTFKSRSDLDRLRERRAVVLTAHVKAARIFQAEEEMDRASLMVGDGDRVIVSYVVWVGLLPFQRDRVLALRPFDVGDPARAVPRSAVVQAAPQHDINRVPIALAGLARLAIGQQRAAPGHNESRDSIELVVVLARLEEIHFFKQRLFRRRLGAESQRR